MKITCYMNLLLLPLLLTALVGCKWGDSDNTIWVYTSLFKDTIAEIEPELKKDFPDVEFKFYQAGSEEVAGKVYAESLAGRIQADVLISSDRFWYEDMAAQGHFINYKPKNSEKVAPGFRHPDGFYASVSHPVMIIAHNNEVITNNDAPKTFKELTDTKWRAMLSSGSPLASGTTFTTLAFLIEAYGWGFLESLRQNNFIAEGGNSGVIRRIQNKERPIGMVLLENVLRLQKTDRRIQFIVPKDGAVIQSNVLAIVKKNRKNQNVQKFADWMFSEKGQNAMVKAYMYASVPGYPAPTGAPPFSEIISTAKPWSQELITKIMGQREFIKEEFSRIMY